MFQRLRATLRRGTALSGIRHALITRIGNEQTFRHDSANLVVDRGEVPAEYLKFVANLPLSSSHTWESAKLIATDIAQRRQRGNGLSRDSVTALKMICSRQGGICSDISQVFTGLCIAASIQVREWGVEEDFATERGHSFNEVFASEYGKWAFLDAPRNIYAMARGSRVPLSVSELVDKVTAGEGDQVEMVYFGPADKEEDSLFNIDVYYFQPTNVFFLLSNNNLFKQDPLLRWAHKVPLAMLHAALLMLGRYPRFEVYTTDKTRETLAARLNAHKRRMAPMLGRLARSLAQT